MCLLPFKITGNKIEAGNPMRICYPVLLGLLAFFQSKLGMYKFQFKSKKTEPKKPKPKNNRKGENRN